MNIMHAGAAGLLAATVLAAASFLGVPGLGEPGLDATTTASLAPAADSGDSFRLVSTAGDGCDVVAGQARRDGLRPLLMGVGCIVDNPALAEARYWLDRPDGTVAFSGANGRILAEFAAADGAAFESYDPPLPVMTLFAQD